MYTYCRKPPKAKLGTFEMLLLNVIHFSYTVHYNVVMPNAFAEFKVTDFSVLFEFIQTK